MSANANDEVIHGAEEEDGVDRLVAEIQRSRIADVGIDHPGVASPDVLYMVLDEVAVDGTRRVQRSRSGTGDTSPRC